ncbi:hypothetical protein E4U17_005856 [Claviceps sp. LM77 group G4]|nr:hypothetical protein E4U17_005856 [Claviceps sp. LM77 group G4]KAG6072132.1 hypothetical protein E4U33_003359 [Claviceps sp. LM78 group G4]KAG6081827.1 hypothetical protein E4U16_006920 [Claviceps sp. LM84 group G4]
MAAWLREKSQDNVTSSRKASEGFRGKPVKEQVAVQLGGSAEQTIQEAGSPRRSQIPNDLGSSAASRIPLFRNTDKGSNFHGKPNILAS